jgi:DNA polymerase-3 subunit epsilon
MMKDLRLENLIVIDVETSGVNPFRHQILSVAIAPLFGATEPKVVYVKHDHIEWTSFARQHFAKYATEWEALGTSPELACAAVEQYVEKVAANSKAIPVGHNIGFDVAFLRQLAFLGGRDQIAGLSHRVIDTHTLLYVLYAAGQIPSSALTSDGAFQEFGISISDVDRHTALGDVLATRELVRQLFEYLTSHFEIEEGSGIVKKHFPTVLDGRQRDQNGEIRRKRDDTLVGTLRDEYGSNVPSGYRADTKLGTVLKNEGIDSLDQLLRKK